MSQKLSDNERIKSQSNFLRGNIAEEINDGLTGGFSADSIQLIKFHGLYQQDDRDIRAERAEQKLEPRHHFLFRARIAGGVVSPAQWLAIDQYASDLTLYGSIRLTTRQTFQYHGILKPNLKSVFQGLDKVGIDSIFTAGDVNRNVMCTSNPAESVLHAQAYEYAKALSDHFMPNAKGYAEIWLDEEKVAGGEQEPIYGATYLPRKFKMTVVIPPQNDVDLHANDLNFVAIAEQGQLVGFNVLIGGGLGMTHGDQATFPRTATEFGYIAKEDAIKIAEAVVTTQRDFGDRSNRRTSKTKYTLERIGVDTFKAEVERRSGVTFAPIRPYTFTGRGDRFGWVEGIDGKWHLTLFIENGRIIDTADQTLKTGLREIAQQHSGDFRLTANQNLIIAGVPLEQKAQIEKLARQHGLLTEGVSALRQNSMACVSLPTCPLAMAEAERYLPGLVTDVEQLLQKHQLAHEHLILRVTGCPNGCGRAMLAEIGLVGKALGRYNLHLGGSLTGERIPRLYRENISEAEILNELDQLIGRWSAERLDNEPFGDFTLRSGIVRAVTDPARDFYH